MMRFGILIYFNFMLGTPFRASYNRASTRGGQDDESANEDWLYEFEAEEESLSAEVLESAIPIKQPPVISQFVGHRNARTMIKEATW